TSSAASDVYKRQEEALTMSDKIVVLDEGKIAQCSSPIEIMSQASCHFVEEFIVNQLAIKQQNIQQIFQQSVNICLLYTSDAAAEL
ncbi:hypothetical protein KQJ29_28570, partial [Enterococcus sp. S181_ASV_20]|nr:hypothetical protein [Enterococcus sp. S181_ASV_20]